MLFLFVCSASQRARSRRLRRFDSADRCARCHHTTVADGTTHFWFISVCFVSGCLGLLSVLALFLLSAVCLIFIFGAQMKSSGWSTIKFVFVFVFVAVLCRACVVLCVYLSFICWLCVVVCLNFVIFVFVFVVVGGCSKGHTSAFRLRSWREFSFAFSPLCLVSSFNLLCYDVRIANSWFCLFFLLFRFFLATKRRVYTASSLRSNNEQI